MFLKLHHRLADVRFVSHKKRYLTVLALIAFKKAHHSSVIKKHKIDFTNRFYVLKRQKNLFSAWFSFKYWNHRHFFAVLSQQAVNWKRNLSFQSVLFDSESDDYDEVQVEGVSLGWEDLPDLVASSADEEQENQNYVELNIRLLTGKRLALNMAVFDTILAVKHEVFLHTGISEEEQRLQSDCYLEDSKTLNYYAMTYSRRYYIDLGLKLYGGTTDLSLSDFKILVASKNQYPNFNMNVQFLQKPQNNKKRGKEIFVDVLILHGLGMCNSILVPQKLTGSGIDVRPILQLLQREFFQPSFKFSTEDVDQKYIRFSDSLRKKVLDFFEQNHCNEFEKINTFLNELRKKQVKKRAENHRKQIQKINFEAAEIYPKGEDKDLDKKRPS